MLCDSLRGGREREEGRGGEGGSGGRLRGERICAPLWLIHVSVRQKPTQHCKAITHQLKINFFKRKR